MLVDYDPNRILVAEPAFLLQGFPLGQIRVQAVRPWSGVVQDDRQQDQGVENTEDQDQEDGLEEDKDHVRVDKREHRDAENRRKRAMDDQRLNGSEESHTWPCQLLHGINAPFAGSEVVFVADEPIRDMGGEFDGEANGKNQGDHRDRVQLHGPKCQETDNPCKICIYSRQHLLA